MKIDLKIGIAITIAIVVVLFFMGSSLLAGFSFVGNQNILSSNTTKRAVGINTQSQTTTMNTTAQTSGENSQALQIQDIKVGTGTIAKSGDQVTVNYVGTLTDGKKFDSSYDRNQPFTFTLGAGQVIKGWDEGVVGMKVGGERKLIIAPSLAYGDAPASFSLKDKTLVFDITLVSVGSQTSAQ